MKAFAYVCAALLTAALPAAAHADYTFSGSGTSGTLVSSGETWAFNADGGLITGGNDWGSPGVLAGAAAYGEASDAFGFEITFSGGGTIDPATVAVGNAIACDETTFCNVSTGDAWLGYLVGPDSIEFLAQSPSDALNLSNPFYFTNIFFDGATPTSFTGSWITSYTPTVTPEPSSLMLLGTGLFGVLGRFAARKRREA